MPAKGLPPGPRGGRYRHIYVAWTLPEDIAIHAELIELCVYSGDSPTKIAKDLGLSHSYVLKVYRKYKPIQGTKDVTITVMSKA